MWIGTTQLGLLWHTQNAAAQNQKEFAALFSFFCVFEWLPCDATEREEDHEVDLLWVTAKARALQEEVGSCITFLWAWGITYCRVKVESGLQASISYEPRDSGG